MNQLLETASSFLKETDSPKESPAASSLPAQEPNPPKKEDRMPAVAKNNVLSDSSDWMRKIMPILTAMNQSGQSVVGTDKWNLLHALKPFVAADVGRQMERAVRLIGMTRMAKTAMRELGGNHHTTSI
jgi:hypothetical protein